jgi:hypothetical protein
MIGAKIIFFIPDICSRISTVDIEYPKELNPPAAMIPNVGSSLSTLNKN